MVEGVRWHRCLRCDSWLPVEPAPPATRDVPPDRDEIELPLRGKALRDKIVLRVIAIDRALHFIVLAGLGALVLVFAANRDQLRATFYKVVADLTGVTFADSSTLGWLVGVDARLRVTNGRLVVVAPDGPVLDLLRLTGMDRRLTLVHDAPMR